MRVVQKLSLIALFACCGSALADAPAAMQGYPRDEELKMLPPLCTTKLRKDLSSPEYKSALETYGPDFIHAHHYCAGMNFINRYYRTTSPLDKRFVLQEAVNNFNYVFSHAQPDFVLLPEVYLQRGIAYSLSKNPSLALADIQKSIALNPKISRAYLTLADLYEELKLRDKALATVTEGLRHTPSSKPLQRRYGELGGKQPFPDPYTAPETKPDAAEAPPSKPSDDALSPKAIRAKREGDAQDPGIPSGASAATPPAATPEPTVNVEPPKIGSPTNPYCRFCTD